MTAIGRWRCWSGPWRGCATSLPGPARPASSGSLSHFSPSDRKEIAYAEAAAATGLSEGAARVAVHRLRKRYRELFREEIARTVAEPDEVDAELRHLIAVLAGR